MAEDKISYSDIIQPDDSIEKLVAQLAELNRSYETVVTAIKAGAEKIANSMKSASGATAEGRKAIDEASMAASRLERAQRELSIAMSDTGKQIAWIKAQTVDQNKATVEQQRYLQQAVSSYDRLKTDLKQTVALYKSLTDAERQDSAMGQQLLQDILNLKNQIKALDDSMKPHIQRLTEVEKAEQRLAFLESEEGQKLLELKRKIAEVTGARKQQKAAIDPIVAAQEKLARAQSNENIQLQALNKQTSEANRIAKLRATIRTSAEGSYNRLAAVYELNKIRLNAMSKAERENSDSGKRLEAQTYRLYQKMIKLQEATGNHRLSVGHYAKSWDGLGFSVSQVVRELPSAAVSLNTFFLAISNNIPMLVDEINKVRAQNKLLAAEGKPLESVTKRLASAFFSWNTALVLVLTAFSMYGKQITEFVINLFKGKEAVISTQKALNNIAKELKSTNGSYGSHVVKIKELQAAWKNLKTVAEKNQWIRDNKSEFDSLDLSVRNTAEAERIFVEHTDELVNALKHRAKAAAAMKLATDKYEEELTKRNKAETLKNDKPGWQDQLLTPGAWSGRPGISSSNEQLAESNKQARVQTLVDEADKAKADADAYFDLAEAENEEYAAKLKALGIEGKHRDGKHGREPRDLTDTINKNQISIQKKYEESVTKLQEDEYAKRKKAAADQIQDENNKLRELYRKNEAYVANIDKKYKALTEEQKKQIAQQQDWITKTLANNLQILDEQLKKIMLEEQKALAEHKANTERIGRESVNKVDTSQATEAKGLGAPVVAMNVDVTQNQSGLEESLVRERELMEQALELEYKLIMQNNARLIRENSKHARSEEEIVEELNKKKIELWNKYDKQILSLRAKNIEDQLALVKKGTKEELNLLLLQIEIQRQAALSANAAAPASQQVGTDTINALFDKKAKLATGSFGMTQFDQQQKLDEAIFNETKRSQDEITKFKLQQERDRWIKQIDLAKSGALDWSDTQIEAAEHTVNGINRQIKELNDPIGAIAKYGVGGGILHMLGFNDEQIKAMEQAVNIVVEQLQAIAQAEVDLAQKAVDAANERVEAAQKAYDAEVEARNNGYANNVATAKKELEDEKKKQLEKQKILEAAQKRQEAINTVTQVNSLVTASAELWESFGGMGIVGPILAAAAIAAMFTSFAAAKIKARQVANASSEYGEGGLEFLEGGSHASGNDIDLGVSNKKKRRMKAEGGEALAIINRRKTRKYRKVLPDIIDSLNKGVFEDKYMNAFAKTDGISMVINSNNRTDLSTLEHEVSSIRKQNETKYYVLPDGATVIQYKNVKRIIRS